MTLLFILLTLAQSGPTSRWPTTMTNTAAPVVRIFDPKAKPEQVSEANINLVGGALDNVGIDLETGVTASCVGCSSVCSSITLEERGSGGAYHSYTWSCAVTLGCSTNGTLNTITIHANDADGGTPEATDILRRTCISPDSGNPNITITTNDGADYSIEASSTTLDGTCIDDVACVSVSWSGIGGSGSCTVDGNTFSCTDVLLEATDNLTTANTITINGLDGVGHSDPSPDTIIVTRVMDLTVITDYFAPCTAGVACVRNIIASGGTTGDYSATVQSGSLPPHCSVSGMAINCDNQTTVGSPYEFVIRVSDTVTYDDSITLSLQITAAPSGDEYFNTLKALGNCDATKTYNCVYGSNPLKTDTQLYSVGTPVTVDNIDAASVGTLPVLKTTAGNPGVIFYGKSLGGTSTGRQVDEIAAPAKLGSGTISLTNGSATVTGVSTHFTTQVLGTSKFIRILNVLDSPELPVASIESDTSLTLASTYSGTTTTGKKYHASDPDAGSIIRIHSQNVTNPEMWIAFSKTPDATLNNKAWKIAALDLIAANWGWATVKDPDTGVLYSNGVVQSGFTLSYWAEPVPWCYDGALVTVAGLSSVGADDDTYVLHLSSPTAYEDSHVTLTDRTTGDPIALTGAVFEAGYDAAPTLMCHQWEYYGTGTGGSGRDDPLDGPDAMRHTIPAGRGDNQDILTFKLKDTKDEIYIPPTYNDSLTWIYDVWSMPQNRPGTLLYSFDGDPTKISTFEAKSYFYDGVISSRDKYVGRQYLIKTNHDTGIVTTNTPHSLVAGDHILVWSHPDRSFDAISCATPPCEYVVYERGHDNIDAGPTSTTLRVATVADPDTIYYPTSTVTTFDAGGRMQHKDEYARVDLQNANTGGSGGSSGWSRMYFPDGWSTPQLDESNRNGPYGVPDYGQYSLFGLKMSQWDRIIYRTVLRARGDSSVFDDWNAFYSTAAYHSSVDHSYNVSTHPYRHQIGKRKINSCVVAAETPTIATCETDGPHDYPNGKLVYISITGIEAKDYETTTVTDATGCPNPTTGTFGYDDRDSFWTTVTTYPCRFTITVSGVDPGTYTDGMAYRYYSANSMWVASETEIVQIADRVPFPVHNLTGGKVREYQFNFDSSSVGWHWNNDLVFYYRNDIVLMNTPIDSTCTADVDARGRHTSCNWMSNTLIFQKPVR